MDKKISYLKMIQEIIGRFSKNSFTIKSWNITLLTGFLAYGLQANIENGNLLAITLAFTIGFMCLDWYYLNLEKSYRNLYKNVCKAEEINIDYRLEINRTKEDNPDLGGAKASIFYGIKRPITFLFYGCQISFLLVFLLNIRICIR